MKRLLTTVLFLATTVLSGPAHAQSQPFTADQIRGRLEVSGEIYIFDATGKKLEAVGASKSTWRSNGILPIESNWGNSSKVTGNIYIHTVWTVNSDATISVLIEEYAREVDRTFLDLLKKSEFVLEGFAPVNWQVLNNKGRNIYVRLTPSLREEREAHEFANLPIAGRNVIISDNKGYLWNDGDGTSFDGTYIGISTIRGTVAFSYKPFKGATLVGEAWGDHIVLEFDGDMKVKLRSDTAFMPDKVGAKVFGIYLPDLKTATPNSTHIFSSSTEETLLGRIGK